MNCPNCGITVPDGMTACPNCNQNLMDLNPTMAMGGSAPVMGGSQKKSNKGLIIGIVSGIVAVIAIVLVIVLVFMGGSSVDGKYVYTMKEEGISIEMVLEIDGDEFEMTMGSGGLSYDIEGECKIKGNKISLIYEGEELEGKFTDGKKAIVIEDGGEEMKFKKK